MILIDASVALKWYLPEADSDAAIALTDQELCAPSLILAEVANGLWRGERLGHLQPDSVRNGLTTLSEIFSELTPLDLLLARASEIGRDLDHPVYDCIYLADAERRGVELVTADKRLLRRLAGSAYGHLAKALS
ncbi:MAG: type II toxin-antitoxin system VapC family toxin [Parasphingopyxis sp.]|nr:type II toxin-antitoxin system VapC family toxin [Sphingomonadales bacterium]